MNDLQKVADAISGYNPLTNEAGAHNDYYYYECFTKAERIKQIIDYGENALGAYLAEKEAEKVDIYLQSDFEDQSMKYYAFEELN